MKKPQKEMDEKTPKQYCTWVEGINDNKKKRPSKKVAKPAGAEVNGGMRDHEA